MNIIQAIFLGIIQGITEFLPISSSAHLVIFPYLLGWRIPTDENFSFDVLVQLGTLLSLIIYFRKDLWQIILAVLQGIKDKTPFKNENSRLGWLVLLATIPAGFAGILLKNKVEAAFGSPALTAFFLFGTAFLLVIAEVIGKRSRSLSELTWKNAIVVGFFQAISIFPGISRSGSCIAGGILQNYHRKDAARFSFLLAIPIMLAAGLLGVFDLIKVKALVQFLPMLMAGFIASALVGYLVIHWMLNYLNKHSLFVFAGYCIILGVLVLGFSLLDPQKSVVAAPIGNFPAISVNYPSSLSWLAPIINECNQKNATLSLTYEEQPIPSQSTLPVINLGFEDINDSVSTTYLIGYETLKIVSNKNNPLVQLNLSQLKELFEGANATWADFIKRCDQCPNKNSFSILADKSIQLWVYPNSNYEQKIFSRTILNNSQPSLLVNIAPDVSTMAEALQINPAAIGFLPAHWINDSLKSIEITDLNAEEIKFPIVASVSLLPVQSYEELLLCIQNSMVKNESR
jgi:undecaprenyl-diphosphatase